jgi:hypothetical protein
MLKASWAATLLSLAVIVGCQGKPEEKIPTTPPLAPSEAHLVLKNLQYIAVRKDYKNIPLIAPVAQDVVFQSGSWFHFHAGKIGIALDEKELQDLGMLEFLNKGYISNQPLKMFPDSEMKLDQFPPPDPKSPKYDPTYDIAKARVVYNAGVFRLTKGIPAEMWPELVVMENKPDASNAKVRQLVIGYKATPILNMAVFQKEDGKWALVYVLYKQWPEQLKKLVQAP